jgi:hypothetical protein
MIALFYLGKPRYGGWVTFTEHLARSLLLYDAVQVFKVGIRDEGKPRKLSGVVEYTNISADTAEEIALRQPSVITAVDRSGVATAERLLALRAPPLLVVHDPTELRPGLLRAVRQAGSNPVCIRREGVRNLAKIGIEGTFIPHPYARERPEASRLWRAVCWSRIDFDKYTHIIAQANELLPPDHRCHLFGDLNGGYPFRKAAEFPKHWQANYGGAFDKVPGAGALLAARAEHAVDLSAIKGDGGGTQYTFLEAWDAGATLIVNRAWLRDSDDAIRDGETAHSVGDAEELADLLDGGARSTAEAGFAELEQHEPRRIGRAYVGLMR